MQRLSLLVLAGVDSTNQRPPFLLAYIAAESAETFAFIKDYITDFIFYDIPGSAVCIEDFAQGLSSAMAEFKEQKTIAAATKGRKSETHRLQTCNWHAIEIVKAKSTKPDDIPRN